MAKLRLGLTISGAISLGAYEGGALAALLLAVQQMRGAVVIDVITGASAGAITAVLAARSLVRGVDPVDAMVEAWVELPALERLATRSRTSPLSTDALDASARRLLGGGKDGLPDGATEDRQPGDVRVAVTLAALGGFEYRIRSLGKGTTVRAMTNLDWAEFTFREDTTDAEWGEAASAALASGANAVGFPPKLLVRSEADRQRAEDNGIVNPHDPLGTWYTDGGTIDNEPFGRVLDLAADAGSSDDRLYLFVHPHPSDPPEKSLWYDPTSQPRWSRTALRAKKLQGLQTIYDDLRKLEKTNTRLDEVDRLVDRLVQTAEKTLANEEPRIAEQLRAALVESLRDEIEDQQRRRAELDTMLQRAVRVTARETSTDLRELLCKAVQRATGLAGKRPARVEIVSPALDPQGRSPKMLLSGETLGHFFGFLGVRFRRSDFALGYDHMRIFLRDTLPDYGVGPEVTAAMRVVDERFTQLGWTPGIEGSASFKSLTGGEKRSVARLGLHIAKVVWSDLRHWNTGHPLPARKG